MILGSLVSRACCRAALALLVCLAPASVRAGEVGEQLRLRLDAAAADAEARLASRGDDLEALRRFYLERDFQLLWFDRDGANEAAESLAGRLAGAEEDGLSPRDYDAAFIAANLDVEGAAARADLEFRLSRALLRYGGDLSAGRVDPARVDGELYLHPSAVPPIELLGAVGGGDFDDYLAALAPGSANYQRLKAALAEYRRLAAAGGWGTVPDGETLKPGMSEPAIVALRRRLAASGDLDAAAVESETFDDVLEAAVRKFQYRHGLDVDGAVGKRTRAALDVSVTGRIEQILLNMERRRWMPDDLGHTYVFVNMADFVLKVVVGPKTILDTRIVVGKPYHRTPVFSDAIRYIVLNPYWTIPPSIARKEILPKLRKDAGYLTKRNIKLFSGWDASAEILDPSTIDWQSMKARNFGYKLRQEPGEGNALGNLKFMFPNRFNVYLHDTQSRQLFRRTVRSFSHGCIRVEHPERLAAVLLGDDEAWSLEKITAAIEEKKRKVVNLKKPIPVHLTYLTAWVNKDGSVHFRADIYERDKRLQKALDRLGRRL